MIVNEEAYLEHFGKKGMKWGVRRTRRIQRMADAGVKGGDKAAKVRAITGRLGPVDLIRGRGITGGAARKSVREMARDKRVKAGEATTKDLIVHVGSYRVQDMIPVKTKNVGKKTIMDNHKLVVAAGGALLVANILGKRAGSNA